MKLTPLLALAALALGLATGPARAEERVYDMPTFERVEVTAGVSAIVEAGPAQAIRADAPNAATLDRLTVDVRGGTLRLGIEGNLVTWLFNLGQRRPIVVHVTAPAIRAAAASSGADIDVRGLSGDAQLSASSGAAIVATIAAGADVSLDASSGASLRVRAPARVLLPMPPAAPAYRPATSPATRSRPLLRAAGTPRYGPAPPSRPTPRSAAASRCPATRARCRSTPPWAVRSTCRPDPATGASQQHPVPIQEIPARQGRSPSTARLMIL